MKVLLINPPAENTVLGNNPTIIDEERGYNPPLGLLYIAAYLQENSSHEVEVIDSQAEELNYSQLAKELDPDFVHITITTPFPATELYREGLEKGVWKEDFWKSFAVHPSKNFRPLYWEEELSEMELWELLEYAYKSFYARPAYVAKQLVKIKSWPELKRKLRAGLKVLRI